MRLFHRKAAPRESYDPALLTPAIRSSICTGEKAAGFIERESGKFREVMLLKSPADLEKFREKYGITGDIETTY